MKWIAEGKCSAGEKEWYFFCRRGRKYKNSVRPNRVTRSGFWKATGIDRPIYSSNRECIGLKKSLVYYRGSAGKGTKTDWMMHEFRLPTALDKSTKHIDSNPLLIPQEAVRILIYIYMYPFFLSLSLIYIYCRKCGPCAAYWSAAFRTESACRIGGKWQQQRDLRWWMRGRRAAAWSRAIRMGKAAATLVSELHPNRLSKASAVSRRRCSPHLNPHLLLPRIPAMCMATLMSS